MSETRDRLLDAARDCVRREGLAGATSRQITAEADVNLAAITYHFGSKDALVAAALVDELRSWLAPALDVLAGEGEPGPRMLVAVETLISTFERRRDDAPALLEALVYARRLPPLHSAVLDLWRDLQHLLAQQIEAMRSTGDLPTWVEPATMASLLVAVTNGLVLQVTVDPDGPGLRPMATQFGGLLLAARRAPG